MPRCNIGCNVFIFQIVNDDAPGPLRLAVNQRKYLVLVRVAVPTLLPVRLLAKVATDEGFVNLHDLARATHRNQTPLLHGLADAVRHKPGGFVRYAQGAVNLVGRAPLLRGAKKVSGQEPLVKGDMRGLEYRTDFDRKIRSAVLIRAAILTLVKGVGLFGGAALGADRPVRPPNTLKVSASGFFGLEVLGDLLARRLLLGHTTILAG